jgi:peptidoglycan/LPS O-acetylase OafA/YrhL
MDPKLINTISIIKVLGAIIVTSAHYAPHYLNIKFYSFGTCLFLILTGLYAYNFEKTTGVKYLVKRIVRLLPGFLIASILYLVISNFEYREWPGLLFQHATFLIFSEDVKSTMTINPAFWVMPVFMTFYIFFSIFHEVKTSFNKTITLIASSLILDYSGIFNYSFIGFVFIASIGMFFYMIYIGSNIGKIYNKISINKCFANFGVLTLITLVIFSGLLFPMFETEPKASLYNLYVTTLYSLLILFLLKSSFTEKSYKLITFLSQIGFGIYLLHNFSMELLKSYISGISGALAAFAFTILISWLIYKFIEQPIYLKLIKRKRNQ